MGSDDPDDPLFVAAFSALMHKTARLDGNDWVAGAVKRAREIADETRAEYARQVKDTTKVLLESEPVPLSAGQQYSG